MSASSEDPVDPSGGLRGQERRVQTVCLLVLATIAVGAALRWLQPVMVPFVLAVFFALTVSPLIDLMVRHLRMPRPLAVGATLGLTVLALAALGFVVSLAVRQLAANAAQYQQQLSQLIHEFLQKLPLERFGFSPQEVWQPFSKGSVSVVGNLLLSTTNAVFEILSRSVLMLIFLVFLLVGREARRRPEPGLLREVELRVRRYLVALAWISATTGALVGITLAALGVPLALSFGLFAFLLNFIPNIGSIVATLLPVPVVLATPGMTPTTAVAAIAIPGVIQFVIGNLVQPRVMSVSLDLHPVVVLMALIFWGMLWGIVGMLIATPIMAILRIWLAHLEVTRPAAELLAGRLDALQDVPP